MKRWPFALLAIVILGGVLFWKREPLAMGWFASKIEKTTLAERENFLEPYIEVRLPDEGAAPFPVVLQFHGCAGIRKPFHRQWADVANRMGYAAMIVDSTGPRGYSRPQAVETVCGGKALLGQERTGDILAALKLAEADPRLDAGRLIVAAWSHGAWSVMDYLTMDPTQTPPPGIRDKVDSAPQIEGAILFYPHCGLGALSRFKMWKQTPPILALIAGEDAMVNEQECEALFDGRKASGASINMIVYPHAQHVFDDPFLEPEWIHWYNEEYHKDAEKRYAAFLARFN